MKVETETSRVWKASHPQKPNGKTSARRDGVACKADMPLIDLRKIRRPTKTNGHRFNSKPLFPASISDSNAELTVERTNGITSDRPGNGRKLRIVILGLSITSS